MSQLQELIPKIKATMLDLEKLWVSLKGAGTAKAGQIALELSQMLPRPENDARPEFQEGWEKKIAEWTEAMEKGADPQKAQQIAEIEDIAARYKACHDVLGELEKLIPQFEAVAAKRHLWIKLKEPYDNWTWPSIRGGFEDLFTKHISVPLTEIPEGLDGITVRRKELWAEAEAAVMDGQMEKVQEYAAKFTAWVFQKEVYRQAMAKAKRAAASIAINVALLAAPEVALAAGASARAVAAVRAAAQGAKIAKWVVDTSDALDRFPVDPEQEYLDRLATNRTFRLNVAQALLLPMAMAAEKHRAIAVIGQCNKEQTQLYEQIRALKAKIPESILKLPEKYG